MTKEELKKLVSEKKLKFEQLRIVVLNFKSNDTRIPIAQAALGGIFCIWAPWWQVLIWWLVSSVVTLLGSLNYRKFLKIKSEDYEKEDFSKWAARIIIPRFIFVLLWISIFVFWDPAKPETFFLIFLFVSSTMPQNAATSGAFLPMMFAEVLPKAIACLLFPLYLATYYSSDLNYLYYASLISIIPFTFFVIKLGKDINATALIQLQQRYEIEHAKNKAEEASKAKSTFLATMSHEVRTPLNGILGMANLLRGTVLNPKQAGYVDTIRYSGDTLLAMLNDILDFSKMEAGKLKIEKLDFDLKRLIESVADLMHSRAREKNLEINISIDTNVPDYIHSDPTRLRQVLLNLVSNAIKFTENGSIEIKVSRGAGPVGKTAELQFKVKDTGIGISEEAKANLFKEFTQADSSTSRKYGGTGLGLSICKQIVTLLDGNIGVNSQEGKGSTFWFEIPVEVVSNHDFEFISSQTASAENFTSANILLVDDNEINLKVGHDILEKYGHKVTTATNGEEALSIYETNSYDIILMDVQMPVMDGLEATRVIRARNDDKANIPILALTANSLNGENQRCLAAGMNGHVGKPFDPLHLLKTIEDLIANKVKKDDAEFDATKLYKLESVFGRDYVIDMLQTHLPSLESYIDNIKAANENNSTRDALRNAQELKNVSDMFGLNDLKSIAEGIEICCTENRLQELASLVSQIPSHYQTNMEALSKRYPLEGQTIH